MKRIGFILLLIIFLVTCIYFHQISDADMVGARGFEPPTPCSQSRCAKPDCATPRYFILPK